MTTPSILFTKLLGEGFIKVAMKISFLFVSVNLTSYVAETELRWLYQD
jgi:hypothetical protein